MHKEAFTILLITTGGTIAGHSQKNDTRGKTLHREAWESLSQSLLAEGAPHEQVSIEVAALCDLDSTELGPEHWEQLRLQVTGKAEEYDAFVITHGTNTLGYTAAALAFGLGPLHFPVILTGAQYPIGHPDSDGPGNLREALLAALLPGLAGVFVSFGGSLLPGVLASKLSDRDKAAFTWPGRDVVGTFEDSGWQIESPVLARFGWSGSAPQEVPATPLPMQEILVIRLHPGIAGSGIASLMRSGQYRALCIMAFGSGDLPASWQPALTELREQGIPVLIHSQVPFATASMTQNRPGKDLLDAGLAIPAGNMSPETALVKLAWLLTQGFSYEQVFAGMRQNICGEVQPPQ